MITLKVHTYCRCVCVLMCLHNTRSKQLDHIIPAIAEEHTKQQQLRHQQLHDTILYYIE